MKNQLNTSIEVGQEFEVEFQQNKNRNDKPICRIGSKIAFIEKSDNEIIDVESKWIVRIDEIKDKCIIITPLTILKTAEQMKDIKA